MARRVNQEQGHDENSRRNTIWSIRKLREVEATDALLHCRSQAISEHGARAVLRKLQIVDTRHDAREVVIRCKRGLVWLAHNSERRTEPTEA